nr:MAG TPA: hypothetical protein [Bacteriophage sp.]
MQRYNLFFNYQNKNDFLFHFSQLIEKQSIAKEKFFSNAII